MYPRPTWGGKTLIRQFAWVLNGYPIFDWDLKVVRLIPSVQYVLITSWRHGISIVTNVRVLHVQNVSELGNALVAELRMYSFMINRHPVRWDELNLWCFCVTQKENKRDKVLGGKSVQTYIKINRIQWTSMPMIYFLRSDNFYELICHMWCTLQFLETFDEITSEKGDSNRINKYLQSEKKPSPLLRLLSRNNPLLSINTVWMKNQDKQR